MTPLPANRMRFPALALLGLLVAHMVPALLLLSRPDFGSEAWDQNYHHAVLVARFSQTLDDPDFTDYPSATAPGYHLLLGGLARVGVVDEAQLAKLYPWTARAVPQAEVLRMSRLAQGMSQLREWGIDTILEDMSEARCGGNELEWITAEREGRGNADTARALEGSFGAEGRAFVAAMRGDEAGEEAASAEFRRVLMPLRFIQLMASVAMLAVCWLVATRLGLRPWTATAIALPAAWNPYVLAGGAWITTDCVAMLCAALALGDAVARAEAGKPPGWVTAFAMIAAVMVRQSFLWVEGAVVTAALLPAIMGDRPRWREMIPSAIAIAMPLFIVGFLVAAWGGLVPPAYASRHGASLNPAAILMLLAVIAVWGGMLALQLRGDRMKSIGVLFLVALALACVPPSAFDPEAGRFGGFIWSLARVGPTLAGRSGVIIVLAAAGVATAALFARSMRGRGHGRELTVLAMAVATLGASLAVNPKSWERYAEVPIIVLLPIIAAAAARGSKSNLDRRVALAAILPALLAAGLSWWMLLRPGAATG